MVSCSRMCLNENKDYHLRYHRNRPARDHLLVESLNVSSSQLPRAYACTLRYNRLKNVISLIIGYYQLWRRRFKNEPLRRSYRNFATNSLLPKVWALIRKLTFLTPQPTVPGAATIHALPTSLNCNRTTIHEMDRLILPPM